MDVLKKVPVREQEPAVRAKNFDEVCLGYNEEEAKEEASRCLNCKNAQCMKGCPVAIHIPEFINEVKNSSSVAVTYYPEINRYQGRETLQIVIRNYLTE